MLFPLNRIALIAAILSPLAFSANWVESVETPLEDCRKLLILHCEGDYQPKLPERFEKKIPGSQNRREVLWHVAGDLTKAGKIVQGLFLAVPETEFQVRYSQLIWGETLVYVSKRDGTPFSAHDLVRLPKPPITQKLPFSRELPLSLVSAKDADDLLRYGAPTMTPPGRAHFLLSELVGLTGIAHMAMPDESVRSQLTAEVVNSIREVARMEFFRSLILGAQMPNREDWIDSLQAKERRDLAEAFTGKYNLPSACAWLDPRTWLKQCKKSEIVTVDDFKNWLDQNKVPAELRREILQSFTVYQKKQYQSRMSLRVLIYPGHNVSVSIDVTLDFSATLGVDGRFFLLGTDFRKVLAFASRTEAQIAKEPHATVAPFMIEPGIEVHDEVLQYHTYRLDVLAGVLQGSYTAAYRRHRDPVAIVDEIDPPWTVEAPFSGAPAPLPDKVLTLLYSVGFQVSGETDPVNEPTDPDAAAAVYYSGLAREPVTRYMPRSMDQAIVELLARIEKLARNVVGSGIAETLVKNCREFATTSGRPSLEIARHLRDILSQLRSIQVNLSIATGSTTINSLRLSYLKRAEDTVLAMANAIKEGKTISFSSSELSGQQLHAILRAATDRHAADRRAIEAKRTESTVKARSSSSSSSSSSDEKAKALQMRLKTK